MAGKHLLVTVRVWDPIVALDSELNGTSLCSFCSHYTYRAAMPFFLWLRHIFYCISWDGWCAADMEIYRPLARSGRALRRVFWHLANTLVEENKSWHFMGSEWEGRSEREKGAGDGGTNERHSVFLLCICHGHEDRAKREHVGCYLETCQR